MPFVSGSAGCGSYVDRGNLAPKPCGAEPTHAGLIMFRRPSGRRYVVREFTCATHADHLDVARPIQERDRPVLQRRRDREQAQLAGRAWSGEDEQPVAWGREADELMERARAWMGGQA